MLPPSSSLFPAISFFFFFWSVSFARFSLFTQSLKDYFLLYIYSCVLTHSYRISIILCNLLIPKSAFPGLTSLLSYSPFLPSLLVKSWQVYPTMGTSVHIFILFWLFWEQEQKTVQDCSVNMLQQGKTSRSWELDGRSAFKSSHDARSKHVQTCRPSFWCPIINVT